MDQATPFVLPRNGPTPSGLIDMVVLAGMATHSICWKGGLQSQRRGPSPLLRLVISIPGCASIQIWCPPFPLISIHPFPHKHYSAKMGQGVFSKRGRMCAK